MMNGLSFQATGPEVSQKIVAAVNAEIVPGKISHSSTVVQRAILPFYDDFRLYLLMDMAQPGVEIHRVLYKPGSAHLLDWSNEPIYQVNEIAPIKVHEKSVIPYAKFFFGNVRSKLGSFTIVEKPEDLVWHSKATHKEKKAVFERLVPITIKDIDSHGTYRLAATVLFAKHLFSVDIIVVSRDYDVADYESGTFEHIAAGQMELRDEELLLEDLHIVTDLQPQLVCDGSNFTPAPLQNESAITREMMN